MPHPADRDHVRAVRRRTHRQPVVAGGGHHHHALRRHLLEHVDVGRAAGGRRAEAEVDHVGRERVRRHAGHGDPGGPLQRIQNVRGVAAALAEHAHRQHHHVAADAGHADSVVRRRADQAGRLRAVPRAAADVARDATAHHADIGRGDAIARVGRVGVAAAAVVRRAGIGDEVVARQQLACQVGVVGPHPRVEHRHDHTALARRDRPRRFDVDGRQHTRCIDDPVAVRRPQVPLADGRCGGLAGAVQRVVRRRLDAHALIDHRVFHIGLRGEPGRQVLRAHAGGVDELRARPHHAAVAQRQAEPGRQGLGLLRAVGFAACAQRSTRREGAHQARVGLELDDHARLGVAGGPARRVADGAGSRRPALGAERRRGPGGGAGAERSPPDQTGTSAAENEVHGGLILAWERRRCIGRAVRASTGRRRHEAPSVEAASRGQARKRQTLTGLFAAPAAAH